ncbi:hypothetical protein EYR40_009195 [Pleurotus pulmonarius]|nr:hypothetical protein EYR36_002679 [Pleurotus pulmonarius]KAF4565450.1 hypothetical protein EYR36_002021 [Pleurotus pulmonarius]KAF4577449.1 hypothetical protein EYR36_005438 [Pleurotus pulmonarius]KAF4586894.1 hypothetical protein EYR40_010911 [Pleurotus pulmonarius]KAF4590600.1 hypothetical protein EYR40_009195 [Pleurotus pulmonarius]
MVLQYELQRSIQCTYDDNLYIPKTIAFSPGGQYIAAAFGTCVCVWQCSTGDKEYEVPYEAKALSVAWTDERQFICGFADGMLLIATIEIGKHKGDINHKLVGFDPLNSPVEFISLHHSHSSIAIGGDDIVQIWEPSDDGYLKHVITIPPPPTASRDGRKVKVTSIGWVDRETIIVSYLNDGILMWNVASNGHLRPRPGLPVRNQCPRGLVAPDGRHFVALSKANAFHLYHIDSCAFLHSFRPDDNAASSPSYHPALFIHNGSALLGASGSKSHPGSFFSWQVNALRRRTNFSSQEAPAPVELSSGSRTKALFVQISDAG